jgi:hypothetical protein
MGWRSLSTPDAIDGLKEALSGFLGEDVDHATDLIYHQYRAAIGLAEGELELQRNKGIPLEGKNLC